jgi:phage gp46-like protein
MDLRLQWTGQGADLVLAGADLATDDGLETAVIVSLFTDRRAEPDDAPPGGPDDRRGWWADAYADPSDGKIGSRLWLLAREGTGSEALGHAEEFASEALAWMVEDGVAESIAVAAEAQGEFLALSVVINRPPRGAGEPAL